MQQSLPMVLDFNQDRIAAFARGFWRGIAAPVSLFAFHSAPAIPQVQQIVPPSKDVASSINGDWMRVGDTIRTVIARYEIEAK